MSGYPYPNDEFDTELDDTHALGIHHSRRSTWSRVWPFLVVVLVCAALAAGLVTWFTAQGRPKVPGTTPAPTTVSTTSTTTGTPTDPTTTPEESEQPTTDEPTDEPTDAPTDEPSAAEIDRSTAIRVLNATSTQGLAAGRVSTLKNAGWTNVVGENFPSGQSKPATTSVWYRAAENEDEAKQVAKDLGIDTVTLVESLRGAVSVVLVN